MSWAGDNPERYTEIVRKGIVHLIDDRMTAGGFTVPGEWLEGYAALIEVLESDPVLDDIYDILMSRASKYITEAEKDYHSSLIDQAKAQHGSHP